ncbi:MAG: 16S rRNA (guanine(527)-N(7))-methyltransferase RsmG [Desulfuromonadaceae bacterium]|nr:16S rRNA (guanine(527)-N(7))-methyltransferase RsmG [Desulfuromonadaceae bacterium]MDD5104237.1 16S rRNA (guanine(527)-N(7))-methyltransferase RsmG [Desulfuromonadaceae bacterium]
MHSIVGEIVASESKSMQLVLSTSEIKLLEVYAAELLKWNRKINLTAITEEKEVAIKHFIDSLALLPFINQNDYLLDIGSGAGLPVIPLKICASGTRMVSVDAVAKKIKFQKHIIRLLKLDNIEAIHTRVEDLYTHQRLFSVITSRAFSKLDNFVSLAAPLIADNGVMIAMKGAQAEEEMTESDNSLSRDGFVITATHRYVLPMGMGERMLTFIKRQ